MQAAVSEGRRRSVSCFNRFEGEKKGEQVPLKTGPAREHKRGSCCRSPHRRPASDLLCMVKARYGVSVQGRRAVKEERAAEMSDFTGSMFHL